MQLDMSALATLEPFDASDGTFSPEKCPSPCQLTPQHSTAQQPTASLDDCTFDHYSTSSTSAHQRPGCIVALPHMVHPLHLHSKQQCSSPACTIQQQVQEHPRHSVPSAPFLSPAPIIQNEQSCGRQCTGDPSVSRDDILMDFWALLQQTQQNLQDMLVDLETAKIELDLANGRASDAENNANALKIQLAAAQQKNNALEGQMQHLKSRDSDASSRASTLTQSNTELSFELRQAQRAAATLELKLERLQLQLAAAQREKAAAATQAAAAASSAANPAAIAAQEAATAAAQALVSQLKAELSQTRSELASTHSRAARAELELAVARTKVLVAQQEASASADRCSRVEAENTTLKEQLGAAAATAEVAEADKQKLEQQIELLTLKIEQKDSRLRNSMSNLARASTGLRASFNAKGGMFDVEALRSSTQFVADIVRKSADIQSMLRASQQQLSQQQQQHERYRIAEDNNSSSSGSGSSTPSGLLTPQACPSMPDGLDMSASSGGGSDTGDSNSVTNSRNISSQDCGDDCAAVAGQQQLSVDAIMRTSSPFAAAAVQNGRNADRSTPGTTDAIVQPQSSTAAIAEDTREVDAAGTCSSSKRQSISRSNSNQGINHNVLVDRQSPIFKRRPSAAGRSSSQSILSPGLGSTAGTAAVKPRNQQGKSTTITSGLPPWPRKTSSSGVSAGGRSPAASPRKALGFSLSPAGSSTPNLMSPAASRRISSSGGSCASTTAAQLPSGVQYEPNSCSSTSKAQGRRCGSSSSSRSAELPAAAGCGSVDGIMSSHQLSIAAGVADIKDEVRVVLAEASTAEQQSAMAGTEAAAVGAEPGCCSSSTATVTAGQTQDDASRVVSASAAQWPLADSAANTDDVPCSSASAEDTATACLEAPDCNLSLHNLPPLRILSSSSAAAAGVALPLLPAVSPPRSPLASRHVCRITQFAAAAPSSTAADSSSTGSTGLVSAAIAVWESQAAAAAAGSRGHAPVGGEPAVLAEGEVTLAEPQHDEQSAVGITMPGIAGENSVALIAGPPAAGSALSTTAEEDGRAPEASAEAAAAGSARRPVTQPASEPDTASAESLTAAGPDNMPIGHVEVEQDSSASECSDYLSDVTVDSEAPSSSRQPNAAPEVGLANDGINPSPEASVAATAGASHTAINCAGPRLVKPRRPRVPRHSVQRWLAAAVLPASSVVVGALCLSVGLTQPTREPTAQQTLPRSASKAEEQL